MPCPIVGLKVFELLCWNAAAFCLVTFGWATSIYLGELIVSRSFSKEVGLPVVMTFRLILCKPFYWTCLGTFEKLFSLWLLMIWLSYWLLC